MANDRQSKVRFTSDNDNLKKGLDEGHKAFKAFHKTVEAGQKALADLPKAFEKTLESGKKLREAFTKDVKEFETYQKAAEKITKTHEQITKGFKGLKEGFGETGKAAKQFGEDLTGNVKNMEAFQKATEKAHKVVGRFKEAIARSNMGPAAQDAHAFTGGLDDVTEAANKAADAVENTAKATEGAAKAIAETGEQAIKAEKAAGGFFSKMGKGMQAFGWMADVVQILGIITTGLTGAAQAANQFLGAFTGGGLDRLPEVMALMQASGVSTGSLQQLTLLQDAIMGNKQAIQGFGISAVTALTDFEAALTQVNTIFDEETAKMSIEELGRSIQDMVNGPMKNLVSSTEALAGQYQVLSGGYTDAAESQQVLNAGLKLSVVGYNDSNSTLGLLVKTMQAYGFESSRAMQTSAELNKIVEQGITTIPELSASFGATATVASQAGLGIQELGAAVAALTAKGKATPEALTGIEALLRVIINKTPQAEKALAELSAETGKAFRFDTQELKDKGLVTMIQDLNEATKGNASLLSEIIPESLAYSTALGLMAENGKKFEETAKGMNEASTGAFDALFNDVAQDRQKRFEAVVNKAQELLIEFGRSLTPMFEGGLKSIEKLIEFIDKIPFKGAIANTILFHLAIKQFTGGLGTLLGTAAKVVQQIVVFRAVNLLFSGELFNELKIIKHLIVAHGNWAGAMKQAIGLNRNRAASLKAAIAWEQASVENQKNIIQSVKAMIVTRNAEKTAVVATTVAKQAEAAATTAQTAVDQAQVLTRKQKVVALWAEAKAQAASTAATGANTTAGAINLATTRSNVKAVGLFTSALYAKIAAQIASTKATIAASGAGAAFSVAMGGMTKVVGLFAKAVATATLSLLSFLANPVVLAAIAVLTPALIVLNEVFRGSTADIRKANESLDEMVRTAASAENQFTKTADSFKNLQKELEIEGKTEGRSEGFANALQQSEERQSRVASRLGMNDRWANATADALIISPGEGPMEATADLGRGANALIQNTMDLAWRDRQRRDLRRREQRFVDRALGYQTNEDGSTSIDVDGIGADGSVAGGVLPAMNRARQGRGISQQVAEKIRSGSTISPEDIEAEKKAYEEINEPLQDHIGYLQKQLEVAAKRKDLNEVERLNGEIAKYTELSDTFGELAEQQQNFLKTSILVDQNMRDNAAGAGNDFKASLQAQLNASKDVLKETIDLAESGQLDDFTRLEDAGLRYAEQIGQGFEQGMQGLATPEQAADQLRFLRDQVITKTIDGQEVTDSPFSPAMRRAWTEQIAQFEQEASDQRVKVIENNNKVMEKTAQLRLASERDTQEKIQEGNLKASQDQLQTLETQIDAFEEFGLNTVELERQAAHMREMIRLQEIENTFTAIENDHKDRMELLEVENRQNQILLADKTISAEEGRKRAAAAAQSETESAIQSVQEKINAAKAENEDTAELEKELARLKDQLRMQELSEEERLHQRKLDLQKQAIQNELDSVRLSLQQQVDLRINAAEQTFKLEQDLFNSENSVQGALMDQQIQSLGLRQKLTADVVEQAQIGVQLAEKQLEKQLAQIDIDRQRLVMDGQMNKLAIERERITNNIAILENEIAKQKLAIDIAEANRNKEDAEVITSLENQLALLNHQGEVLTQKDEQITASAEAQERLNENAQTELDIRESMVREGGAVSIHEAKIQEVTAQLDKQKQLMAERIQQLDLQIQRTNTILDAQQKSFSLESEILRLKQATFATTQNYVQGEYDILIKSETSARRRHKLEKEAGETRLEMLKMSQQMEKANLELMIRQRDMALERQKIENKNAQQKNQAEIAAAKAEVDRQKALRDAGKSTDADVRAAEAGLRGVAATGAGLVVEEAMLGEQGRLNSFQATVERGNLQMTQGLAEDQAMLEYIESLPTSAEKRRLQRQFRSRGAQNRRHDRVRGAVNNMGQQLEQFDSMMGNAPDFEAIFNQAEAGLLSGVGVAAGPAAPLSMETQFREEVARRGGNMAPITVDGSGQPIDQPVNPMEIVASNTTVIADLLGKIHVLMGGEPRRQDTTPSRSAAERAQMQIVINQTMSELGPNATADEAKRAMLDMLRRDMQDIQSAAGGS